MVAPAKAKSGQSVLEQVGPNIIHHVSNSDISHPIIHFPKLFGECRDANYGSRVEIDLHS